MARHEWGESWQDLIESTIAQYPSRTVTFTQEGGEIVGIGGIVPVMRGTEEAWTVLDERAKTLIAVPRAWRNALDYLQEHHQVRRMQALAREDGMPMLDRWHKALGFTYECTLKEYDQGIDHHVYVRFRSWQ